MGVWVPRHTHGAIRTSLGTEALRGSRWGLSLASGGGGNGTGDPARPPLVWACPTPGPPPSSHTAVSPGSGAEEASGGGGDGEEGSPEHCKQWPLQEQ